MARSALLLDERSHYGSAGGLNGSVSAIRLHRTPDSVAALAAGLPAVVPERVAAAWQQRGHLRGGTLVAVAGAIQFAAKDSPRTLTPDEWLYHEVITRVGNRLVSIAAVMPSYRSSTFVDVECCNDARCGVD